MMAKGGKLTKLKSSVMKKWQSMGKLRSTNTTADDNQVTVAKHTASRSFDDHTNVINDDSSSTTINRITGEGGLQQVYVGKSRRRYLIRSDIIDHPLVRELIIVDDMSLSDGITLGCEVVLFEHLLWMIENINTAVGDDDDHPLQQPESFDELVGFYSVLIN